MNCKFITVRSKNYEKKFYCRANKCFIDATTCYCCCSKEYKEVKPFGRAEIKKKTHKVSKMAKACEIPKYVKKKVHIRDKGRCIFCGKYVDVSKSCCHLIPRSLGGLGIEENIFTACDDCHREQDNGFNTKVFDAEAEKYLKNCYEDWNKANLIYRKY